LTTMTMKRPYTRKQAVLNTTFLALAQLFSGVGIASGIAVGGLLAEDLTGSTEFAGFSQTASILGAAITAIPLATLAQKYSRRRALMIGFGMAGVGALCILLASSFFWAPGYFFGMLLVGSATATGLQARYAATDAAPDHLKGRLMSFVVWATTIGSVLGPNLSEPGADFGRKFGIHPLAGPFVFSIAAFAIAAFCTTRIRDMQSARTQENPSDAGRVTLRIVGRTIAKNRPALFGLVTIVTGQMMMSSVMVMTPVHMAHEGDALHLVGLVISMHIFGMYGFSPIFGWIADRFGANVVVFLSYIGFIAAFTLGITDALAGGWFPRISLSLTLLGVGWSASLIGGSVLLTESLEERLQVPLQGISDSLMNFGAAIMAGLSGWMLETGGFALINIAAAALLVVTIIVGIRARFGAGVGRSRSQ
jgi:MFS family permease